MIEIQNLTFSRISYNKEIQIFNGLSLSFYDRVNIIIGNPGAGKTTLLEILSGFTQQYDGIVKISGNKIYLMQEPEKQFIFSNCLHEITHGKPVDKERISAILKQTGLPGDILEMSPWNLSKGERKRLALAKIFENNISGDDRNLFLLDDPFSDMDKAGKKLIIDEIICNKDFDILMTTTRYNDIKLVEDNGVALNIFKL